MTEPLTELPKDLAERAAERHPLEALHDFCVDENAYREGNRGVAGASLKHPNSWVGSSDLGGDVIPALKGLKSAIFEAEPPDLAAMPGLRAEAAIAGLPHRHRWNLAVACAAAGERLAVLEVAAGWAGIARGLERLLVDMLKRPLEGAALSERERVEIRLFNASSRAIAWGSLVDPVIGREVPQDLTDRRAEVERRATSFAVNVFHGLGQQQWADGYAEGVNDVARKEAREAKAEAASKPEPVLGEGLMSELEALQDPPPSTRSASGWPRGRSWWSPRPPCRSWSRRTFRPPSSRSSGASRAAPGPRPRPRPRLPARGVPARR
ncbi:hypothetical protein [Chenggangzhangella methanolivorans]|uniref:Uncharacterized protein n=1 Tax=Chenggangzhangella methanolivorans TaxID=1437009 RepID=A0A9E6R7I5_9HYPH|nr:hypothetical protein [Chenggangzhangella methanolivorans]QZN99650.1 hypothetical protein K6K41_23625 [Chenggangzhangella methanolivorans]